MYYQFKIGHQYNIYSEADKDTTGVQNSIEACFSNTVHFRDGCNVSLEKLLYNPQYSILCTFETINFHEFKSQFPELFI